MQGENDDKNRTAPSPDSVDDANFAIAFVSACNTSGFVTNIGEDSCFPSFQRVVC